MTDSLLITIVLILTPLLISRFIMEKALAKLDGEMKLKLIDAFAKQRKYRLLIAVPVLIIYLLSLKYFSSYSKEIIIVFALLFILYFMIRSFRNYKTVQALSVPESYCKSFKLSSAISFLGLLSFGFYIFYLFNIPVDRDLSYEAWENANKGYMAMTKHDYKEASADYSKAIELDSTESTYFVNRGTSYFNLGLKLSAKRDWEKATLLGDKTGAAYLKSLSE
jgi:tetratricopeptide (TPR) repeat protein